MLVRDTPQNIVEFFGASILPHYNGENQLQLFLELMPGESITVCNSGLKCVCTTYTCMHMYTNIIRTHKVIHIPCSYTGCLQGFVFENGPLSPETTLNYSYQLFEALDYLHQRLKIIHCDIRREFLHQLTSYTCYSQLRMHVYTLIWSSYTSMSVLLSLLFYL